MMEILNRTSISAVCEAARGARWNDSVFGLSWPVPVGIASGEPRAMEDQLS